VSVIASASEASAKQSRSGAATRHAARTEFVAQPAWIASAAAPPRNDGERAVPPPPARHVLHRRPTVIASPRDNFPRHCERERSEREAIQKRRGHNGRRPPVTCCTARLDCFGRFAASQ